MRQAAAPPLRRAIRPQSYAWMFLVSAVLIVPAHLWLARLPYFWDEAGQFVPAALDLLHDGAWIPHSTTPNIHPPALSAYLAAVWRIAGFSPVATRLAMLFLAVCSVVAAFLLAVELTRGAKGSPAFVAVGLLCVSPLFFAQCALAQLDLPAMLFTSLALLLFLQDHFRASAAACVALVLFKETGALIPLTLGSWLVFERRRREAVWFVVPLLILAGWVAYLARETGNWAGNAEFERYNVATPLDPIRILVTLLRRAYYLLAANFHWIGAVAIAYALRAGRLFRSRAWRVAGTLVAGQVLLVTLLGGAVLNRYLLPAMPILFAGMAAALAWLPRPWRITATTALLAGLLASNWINPPYPFPFEENLAFADFIRLHEDAASYLAVWHPDSTIHTMWPMTDELARPELGYVPVKLRVATLANLSAETLAALDWKTVDVLVVFSRNWDPPVNLLQEWPPALRFWKRVYGYVPGASESEARSRIPFPLEMSFTRRGQWVDIYAKGSRQGALVRR